MRYAELFRPWLGVHIVSLLCSPATIPIVTMNSWISRGLVQHMGDVNPGKNVHRVLSLASAVQLHAMHTAVRHGVSVATSVHIGEEAIQRLVACNVIALDGRESLVTQDKLLICYMQDKTLKPDFVSPEELSREIQATGMPAQAPFAMVLEVDHLLDIVWQNYHDILACPEINTKALAGSLKPFPKTLQEALAIA